MQEAMLLDDDGASRIVQLVCEPQRDGAVGGDAQQRTPTMTIPTSRTPIRGCGHVTAQLASVSLRQRPVHRWPNCARSADQPLAVDEFYAGFAASRSRFRRGLSGAAASCTWATKQALGEVELAADLARRRRHVPYAPGAARRLPAGAGRRAARASPSESLYLPIGIGRYALHGQPGTRCFSHVVVQAGGGESRRADIRVFAEDALPAR